MFNCSALFTKAEFSKSSSKMTNEISHDEPIHCRDNLTLLINNLSETCWNSLSRKIHQKVAMVFCDDISAIIAGHSDETVKRIVSKLIEHESINGITLLDGTGTRIDKHSAVIANGTAGDWCELDGGYRHALCHGGLYCIPALIAEAEALNAQVKDVLRALLIGYEIIAKLAKCFEYENLKLHGHASLAAIGAAAAIGTLRKHTPEMIFKAVNSASTLVSPGPFDHAVKGALIRNTWPGLAASNGLRAVDWVELGVIATETSVYQVYKDIFGANCDPEILKTDLNETWEIEKAYHKEHACCQYGHSAVEAARSIIENHGVLCMSHINSATLETHWRGKLLSNPAPQTTLAGKFSMEHIVATTLKHGNASTEAFNENSLFDPDIERLRNRISIVIFEPDLEWPNDRPARLKVELTDGKVLFNECLSAKGGPDLPFKSADIEKKLKNLVVGNPGYLLEPLVKILNLKDDYLNANWKDIIQK